MSSRKPRPSGPSIKPCVALTLVIGLAILTAVGGGIVGYFIRNNSMHTNFLKGTGMFPSDPYSLMTRPNYTDPWLHEEKELLDTLSNLPDGISLQQKFDKMPMLRLPRDLIPVHYNLTFELSEAAIYGEVEITLDCMRSTSSIVLNAQHLEIPNDVLVEDVKQGIRLLHSSVSLNNSIGQLNISFPEKVLKAWHQYKVTVHFALSQLCNSDAINCDMDRNYATKLEPMHARQLFPCFDEPDLKAAFAINVVYSPAPDRVVLSNEQLCNRTIHATKVADHFCVTPRMSTYLVALVVGKFEPLCKTAHDGLSICVWLPPDRNSSTPIALEMAVKAYNKLSTYFVVPYPLSKLDIVGIDNYGTAAMENWGLIVHHLFMLAPMLDSRQYQSETYIIHRIIIHELLHQWFGNLVTMRWWDDIWLNEGFAQYFSIYFTMDQYPVIGEYRYYLALTGLLKLQGEGPNRLALVRNYSNIEALISSFHLDGYYHLYTKGAAIVKMLSDYMQEDHFRDVLVTYLQENALQSVTSDDLWKQLENAPVAGRKFTKIQPVMQQWVLNPGYPELTVERSYDDGRVTVRVRTVDATRYREWKRVHPSDNVTGNELWSIPFVYSLKSGSSSMDHTTTSMWFHSPQNEITVLALNDSSWLLVNTHFQYLYRVNYDTHNWRLLIQQLRQDPMQIPRKSRLQLLVDAMFFLKFNKNVVLYLQFLQYLEKEMELLPWLFSIDELELVFLQYRRTALWPLLQVFYKVTVERLYNFTQAAASDNVSTVEWSLLRGKLSRVCRLACATQQVACNSFGRSANATPESRLKEALQMHKGSECNAYFYCHYLLHHSTEDDRRMLLNDNYSHLQYAAHVIGCLSNQTVLDHVIALQILHRNPDSLFTALAEPFTLEYNSVFMYTMGRLLLQNKLLYQKHLTQDSFVKNIRYAVTTLSDMDVMEQILPPGSVRELEDIRREIEWTEQIAPWLVSWMHEALKY